MNPALKPFVESFIEQEQLPANYFATVERWFLPMVDEILQHIAVHQGTYIIGVTGCQGSGKSTLAALLVLMLSKMLGLRCINLSIDDFYLTHAQRQALKTAVHPLLATRGVPGTHDVGLALATIQALKEKGEVAIPRFNKAIDDRLPESAWPVVRAPVDVIVLEGWCLSVGAQAETELASPVNELEAKEDEHGIWRRYVNDAIRENYNVLYDQVDFLVMLKAPGFEQVIDWRQNQEDKLAARHAQNDNDDSQVNRIMSPDQLKRFVQHYERITRHGMATLPDKADAVFQLTGHQTIDKRL